MFLVRRGQVLATWPSLPAAPSRAIHASPKVAGIMDYFRKRHPEEVAAKEESAEGSEGQIFALEEESQPVLSEEEVNRIRNKSRLEPYHQRLVNGEVPHPEPVFWTHHTVAYKKRMFGKYGEKSGVYPGLLWPTPRELQEKVEFENVCNPFTIQEMVEKRREIREAERRAFEKREAEIDAKMKQLEKFKADLQSRINAKDREQTEARQRREKLMEEVRRHFGYTVDHRDERFQELLAKKEKEQRKAMKEARKLEKQQKQLEKIEGKAKTKSVSAPSSKKKDEDDDD